MKKSNKKIKHTQLLDQSYTIANGIMELITLCIKQDKDAVEIFHKLSTEKENIFSVFVKIITVIIKLIDSHQAMGQSAVDDVNDKSSFNHNISDDVVAILKSFVSIMNRV